MNREKDNLKILLVEDNPGDARLLRETLNEAGIENVAFTQISTLAEALEQLPRDAYDAVLLDLSLPDEQGLATLTRLKKKAFDIPIVILTGNDNDTMALNAVQAGAQDYLVKNRVDAALLERSLRYAIERKSAEIETKNLRQRLDHADRLASIGQLAAGVAHEINNPAAFILANLSTFQDHVACLTEFYSLLKDSTRPGAGPESQQALESLLTKKDPDMLLAEMKEMVRDNLEGVHRIRSIVKDLKTFSRIEKAQVEAVTINNVIDTACNMVYNELRHRARLVKDLGNVPEIMADPGKLAQVFMNLLVNAAHAIPEGETNRNQIRIVTSQVGDNIVITVRDTGCGISKATQKELFKPFFTTKPRETGTGLGLSLCSDIIRKHGGNIGVESEVGQGSCFTVHLPVCTGLESAKNGEAGSDSEPIEEKSMRVLIIDDELPLLRAMRRTLTPMHDVVTAEGGVEALSILQGDQNFHVILCDLMMPELDGIGLFEAIVKKYPQLEARLVFTTGGAFTPRAKDFLETVSNLRLDKPILPDVLRRTLARVGSGKKTGGDK